MKTLLLAAIFTAGAFAATPVIGIVTASGHFTVQGSEIWGNATLFDGATVETGTASTELSLRNGVKVQLGAKSRARIYADRLMLDAGVGQVAAAAPFETEAAGFRIHAAANQPARWRIGIGQRIEIASLAGTAQVSSGKGAALASIPSGRSMTFAMQAAQNGTVTRTGCLLYKDNRFILQDDNTQEVVELNGQDLASNLGNRVEVTGSASTTRPAVSIATTVVNVTSVSPRSQGGCLVAASTLDARTSIPGGGAPGGSATPTATPKASGGGMSTGAKVGIIVAIAGGGAGAAIALAGSKKSTSP